MHSADVVILLMLAAFIAGYVDAIAGGGGLITVPALLIAGLPPAETVATNKLQGTFGVAASTLQFWRAGHIDVAALLPAVVSVGIGAAAGSLIVSQLDAAWLADVMPYVLVAVACNFALVPSARFERAGKSGALSAGAVAAVVLVGTYDGFFGPGAGSLYLAALVGIAGLGLVAATATTKLLNLTSNVAALAIFLAWGKIDFSLGLPMAAAQVAGGALGARSALRHGGAIIRPMVVVVSVLLAVRLMLY
ncbi:MAG: TSUP family transporter [Hyphomicrobiaceae bacterium]|nr:TSUP family transporter [Hyphomicrobiaceae bacterium]